MPKTYTHGAQTGETAIATIHGLVAELGHVWHPRGQQDFGVDGEIELVDPVTRRALNKLLLAQVKGRSDLRGETSESFYFVCEQDHIDYWLNADVPVLLLVVKRATKEAWWKDVTSWFRDPAVRETGRVEFHKVSDRLELATTGLDWLALGAPSAAPAITTRTVPETLSTNLLPVTSFPEKLYFAPTNIKTFPQSRARLASHGRTRVPVSYLLLDEMIYSFESLKQPPLEVLCSGDVEVDESAGWAAGTEDQRYRFMRLLRMLLGREFSDLGYDREDRLNYFRPLDGAIDRVVKTPDGRKRTVVVNKGGYIRHHAAELRFVDVENEWFMAIQPEYRFTVDGYTKHWNAAALKSGIKRLERHGAVRSTLAFWSSYFSSNQLSLLDDAPPRRLRFGPVETVPIQVSYDDSTLPTKAAATDAALDDDTLDFL
ncbi:MAG: DUF4365 domain-containing protein [Actinobacteria bacterium]|jgi:hypothetical protein|nr:DUF4365 domain-containing protein [Actinomycetota bacterium]